ncbi:MAG: biopolymer transporter ExbD [Ginsengibacter sp.]|jgi:biopolymer transport protein ExbD
MAEIEIRNSNGKKISGVKKSKKQSTKVDLTPMVDLGFLLITFFIFTTTMTQSTSMNLNMPKDSNTVKDFTNIKASGALTLLLGKENTIYYYFRINPKTMQATSYKEIRNIILEKKINTVADDFFVIIKPNKDAIYKNAIAILDEMNINDVSKYAMIDPSPKELDIIEQIGK